MKTPAYNWSRASKRKALTLLELVITIAIIAIIAGLFLPARRSRCPAIRIKCATNLKQIGLVFRIWQDDHNDQFPMQVLTNSIGAALYASSTDGFRYFQIISNELSNPQILICPADPKKDAATNFENDFNGSRISYFLGLNAKSEFPNSFLAGDPNITNALATRNGISELTTNQTVEWTSGWHKNAGNIGLADGSVQQFDTSQLRKAMRETGLGVTESEGQKKSGSAPNCLLYF